MAPTKSEHGSGRSGAGKEVAGAPVDEKKYVWLEEFLTIMNLKKSVKNSQGAKSALRIIENEGDKTEKKKKTGVLTEVLRNLVQKEDTSAVSAKELEELRSFGQDDNLDVEKLGLWMEAWGQREHFDDVEKMGKELKDDKDKKYFEAKKHEKLLQKAKKDQAAEKIELNSHIERLAKVFDLDTAPEIKKLTEELRQASKEVKRASVPETVSELKKSEQSIVEWTRKLRNEDWEKLVDNEPDKDVIPEWVKKIVTDERIEALERKVVTKELLDGVQAIDGLAKLVDKGLSLEDALVRLGPIEMASLRKIYKNVIYRDLRESDPGLLALLERVEMIKNPWAAGKQHIGIGEGGRRESATDNNGERDMTRVEQILKRMVPERDKEQTPDQIEVDEILSNLFKGKDSADFQIFNNVDYNILPPEIKEFIDFTDWKNSRGGAPAYVNKNILDDPEKMKKFVGLWRDRTRLALRKIAYQQSESRQDPVMAELTTLLSIIGVPASEKGMIKIESQIYGMVDALMRGEGNKDTLAKLFTLFTSNGVGFRLIENLKKNREKVYWVKEGVYAGGVDHTIDKYEITGDESEEVRKAKHLVNIHAENDPRRVKEIRTDNEGELRIGVFDFMKQMGQRLSKDELIELKNIGYFTDEDIKDVGGKIENIKMMWGTAIYRKSVDADIDKVKKVFMKKVLAKRGKTKDIYSDKRDSEGNLEYQDWFNDVYGFYGDYIDEAVYFKAVHAETDGIVGNASLKKGSYEFTQGLKEYLVGKLSIQGARYFEAKYGTGNVDEMVGLLDGGVRSIAVMARFEVVNHLIGKKRTTEGNLGAEEVFFSKASANIKDQLVKDWNDLWNKALYHHGNTSKMHHDPTNMFTSFGDESSVDSGLLRPTWSTIEILKKERNSDAVKNIIENIDYVEFAKIVHDDELSAYLTSTDPKITKEMKFDKFIDNFGEDYRTYTGEKSKRWSDWPVKYWISKLDEAFGLIQELSTDPYSVTVQKKLLDLYNSTNASGTPAYQKMLQEAVEWYAKDVGAWGSFTRYKRKIDEKSGVVSMVFDSSKGIYGDDQEFPGIESEKAGGFGQQLTDHAQIDEYERAWQAEHKAHPKTPDEIKAHKKEIWEMRNGKVKKTLWKYVTGTFLGDPTLNSNSLAASYGHGTVGEMTIRQMLLERRGAGFYKNQEEFSREWSKWAKGILWNKEKTALENGWNWFTLNAPFEYVGMVYFGIEGHKFREIFMENTEKNVEKMLHYLNS